MSYPGYTDYFTVRCMANAFKYRYLNGKRICFGIFPPEDGVNYKDVVVEIERCTKRKPFIGGFKHRVTGSEFHNASAQTLPKPKPATGKVCV